MFDLFKKPDKKSLEEFSDFLTDTHEDAKPFNLTKAHGFLCAIASAPCMIMPSKYQHVLFGGYPDFQSEGQIKNIIGIMAAISNSINSELRKETSFTPLLWEKNDIVNYETASLELLGEWCDGYTIATELDPKWSVDHKGISMLLPLATLASVFNLVGKPDINNGGKIITDDLPHKLAIKETLPDHLISIYKYWSEFRKNPTPVYGNQKPPMEETVKMKPTTRSSYKIGRNELCPYDSGKKFKHCCGSSDRVVH